MSTKKRWPARRTPLAPDDRCPLPGTPKTDLIARASYAQQANMNTVVNTIRALGAPLGLGAADREAVAPVDDVDVVFEETEAGRVVKFKVLMFTLIRSALHDNLCYAC